MAQTYLNGKITVTSLAAPTVEDMQKIKALSDDERRAMLEEKLERGRNSPVSDKTVDDVWEEALQETRALKEKPEYAI
ncbi:MAG: hypothetical protein AAF228_05975 [Pseudomonadota bacterium]